VDCDADADTPRSYVSTNLYAGLFDYLTYCGKPVDRKAVHHHNVGTSQLRELPSFELGLGTARFVKSRGRLR
jgi:hypothetical protein